MTTNEALKSLPAVSRLLDDPAMAPVLASRGRPLVTALLREALDELREALQDAGRTPRIPDEAGFAALVDERAGALLRAAPRRVINATGVIAHTNLGRSILSDAAAARVAETARGYVDLEYDVAKGARGDRLGPLASLLARLFPGSASLAVNNNAAAIFLALRALAKGREVVVSRGELVEIGGSFRIPDILAASGAKLREVGTTNRTRAADYEAALSAKTGVLLKVHTSNFKVVGFAEETSIEDLAALARARSVPLVVDWGSGDLVDLGPLGVRDELPVGTILARGADLVTFSGDKLLGGPQAGLAVGRADLVAKMRKDPLARALRLDRLQIAALHATLVAYVTGRAEEEVPTLRMMALDAGAIRSRAEAIGQRLTASWSLVPGVSRPGGGSSPVGEIPTVLLAIEHASPAKLEAALRRGDPPVIARVADDRVLLDLRTVLPEQDGVLLARLLNAL
ncbi:MAG TPA: L-seryl-tRNA(Sec) selenium transferase [Candidatus Polarisedimenticolaceae bacterium]|nr:L-seryl-tRNA(Sec) selenium transferase [Candidatus Polarisedimenticolaceae bacterium]